MIYFKALAYASAFCFQILIFDEKLIEEIFS